MRPIRSFPSASVSFEAELTNSGRFDHFAQRDRLPVLIRHFDAHRGFARECARSESIRPAAPGTDRRPGPVMRLYLMPASGLNS